MTEPTTKTALEELRADPASRKSFLRALGGGAAAATFAMTLAACGKKTPAPRPKATFTLDTPKTILATMYQLEQIGARAYLGQVDRIQGKDVLAAALSIHSVEARHAAVIGLMLGQPISPEGAFARPATSVDVTQTIRPFITG